MEKNLSNEQKKKMLSLLNEHLLEDEDNIGNKKEEEPDVIEIDERFLGIPTSHDDVEELVVKMINTSPRVRKVLENIINNVLAKSTIRLSMKDAFTKDKDFN